MACDGISGTVRIIRESGFGNTLDRPSQLCLYLDGEKVHEKAWESPAEGLIHLSYPNMFIGKCPGGVLFNGHLDDLTLWNRSLGQGEVRALNYLDRNLNGIVVPRGLFFQSLLFKSLNDTATFGLGNPLLGSTVMGNGNPLELNARTVQMLVAANLTLAEAWTWLEELCRNESGNLTAFPLAVTREVHTVGFDPALMGVLPNVTVVNSGNSSVPPPPVREPEWWEAAWNTLTGIVSAVWDAVVAVATFVANIALAVINWGIGLAKAIVDGTVLEYIYETVVKPFVELVLWFIRWIIDLISAIVNTLFEPIIRPIQEAHERWVGGLLSLFGSLWSDPTASECVAASRIDMSLFEGPFPVMMFSLVMITSIAQNIAAFFERIVPVASMIGSLIKGILSAAFKSAMEHWWQLGVSIVVGSVLGMFVNPNDPALSAVSAGGWFVAGMVAIVVLKLLAEKKGIDARLTDGDMKGLYITLLGLFLALACTIVGVETVIGATVALFMALVGLIIGLGSTSFTDELGPSIGFLDEAVSAAAFGFSITQLVKAVTES